MLRTRPVSTPTTIPVLQDQRVFVPRRPCCSSPAHFDGLAVLQVFLLRVDDSILSVSLSLLALPEAVVHAEAGSPGVMPCERARTSAVRSLPNIST